MRKSSIGGVEPETKDRFDLLKIQTKVYGKTRYTADTFANKLMDYFEEVLDDKQLADFIALYRTSKDTPEFREALSDFMAAFSRTPAPD